MELIRQAQLYELHEAELMDMAQRFGRQAKALRDQAARLQGAQSLPIRACDDPASSQAPASGE